jgi:pilus assembly protein Flp/PilA
MEMKTLLARIKKLSTDQEGATLIEYTVLLGILLIAVIAIIVFVGGWINNTWGNLSAHLP